MDKASPFARLHPSGVLIGFVILLFGLVYLERPLEFGVVGLLILMIWVVGRVDLRGLSSLKSAGWFLLGIVGFSGLFSPGPRVLGVLSGPGLKDGGLTALRLLCAFLFSYLFSQILSPKGFVAGVAGILHFLHLPSGRAVRSLQLTLSSIPEFTTRLRSASRRFWELPDLIAQMLREPPALEEPGVVDPPQGGLVWLPILGAGAIFGFLLY